MSKKILIAICSLTVVVCIAICLLVTLQKDKISVSDDGYLIVNGNKTEYQVNNPGHTHSFSKFKLYNEDETDCEKKLFYRTCSTCSGIEWKEGSHSYSDTLCFDGSFHWQECSNCGKATEKKEHTASNEGICSDCSAALGDTQGILYALSADKSYAIVAGYEGDALNIKIADSYNGVPVTVIGKEAFNNKKITSVTMPDTITDIEEYAFSCCWRLTSVKLSSSLVRIGASAFISCSGLAELKLPESIRSIGGNAFLGCESNYITEYSFGKYIAVGDNPYGALIEITNKNFTTYEIHKDTDIIASGVFRDLQRLESITIPGSVDVICSFAFDYCLNLKSVVIEKGVSVIEMYAFDAYNIENIYYTGSEDEWKNISIDYYENGNDVLINAAIHYNFSPGN